MVPDCLSFPVRSCLRNVVYTVFAVIVRPPVHSRYLAGPISMTGDNRCSPFNSISAPGIHNVLLTPLENAVEEIKYKNELRHKYHEGRNGNELIQSGIMAEGFKVAMRVVTTGQSCHSHVVHRPEDAIASYHRYPEVDVAHGIVHEPAEHLGEPMIYSCKHSKKSGHSHNYMKVSHHEISIMEMKIQCGVPQEDTR